MLGNMLFSFLDTALDNCLCDRQKEGTHRSCRKQIR